jgi:hypothetical protein
MAALAAGGLAAACACRGRNATAPAPADPPPSVDLARLRSAIRGPWSTHMPTETGSIARTMDFGDDTVTYRETWTRLDGTSTTPPVTAPYHLTDHGAVVMPIGTSERAYTAIVADGGACAALLGRPCRTFGWGGFLAQSGASTHYRREYRDVNHDGRGEQRFAFVATLRFARSVRELARAAETARDGAPCRLDVEVTASATVDGRAERPAHRRVALGCDVTPAARGPLARLTVHGFDRTLRGHDRETARAFALAFEPVLYFDPADPWMLYLEQPGDHDADR